MVIKGLGRPGMGKKRPSKRTKHDNKKKPEHRLPSPPEFNIEYTDEKVEPSNTVAEPKPDKGKSKSSKSKEVAPEPAKDDKTDESQEEAPQEPPAPVTPAKKRKSVAEVMEEQLSDVELEKDRRYLLAAAWRARDAIYQQLFGEPAYVTPTNYACPSEEVPADFAEREKYSTSDTSNPGDPTLEEQHLAVLAYGPDPMAPYWKYVTAGLASPWMQYEPLMVSGFGLELMVKSPVDSPWAAQFLRTLAFHVFHHHGTLSPGVRLGLNSSIDPAHKSVLRNAFIWYIDEVPDTLYDLPSGGFGMFMAVGITDDELKFAESIEEYGTWCIQSALRQAGHGQVTDPSRSSIMKRDDIGPILSSVRNFAETFRANRSGEFTVAEGDL